MIIKIFNKLLYLNIYIIFKKNIFRKKISIVIYKNFYKFKIILTINLIVF